MSERAVLCGISVFCVLAACSKQAPDASSGHADVVLHHGGIYTVDADRSWAAALAVRDGVIVAVGDDAAVDPLIGPDTQVIDLTRRMALPGLHDSHVHPIRGGQMLLGCSLDGILDIDGLLAKVVECAERARGEWVVGDNYDLGLFPQGNANKSLLDAVIADRPVYLRGSDGHSGWANSRALALAGITAATPDPAKGVIERDPRSGEPSGTLRETANDLVAGLIPKPTPGENADALRAALRGMASFGITSVIDAWVSEDQLETWHALDEAGALGVRVRTCLVFGVLGEHQGEDFERVLGTLVDYVSSRVDTGCIKLFLDGVLEGETAALLEPYTDAVEHRGELNFEPAELAEAVTRFDSMGLQVHMHAIGDRAVRAGLDAVAEAQARNGARDRRHHIAHLQLVDPADVPRFASLGVTANFQAFWAFPDAWITGINLPAVGQARVDRMYPIGSIARAGGRIVGGSDWFVSTVNPMLAIETAVRREDPSGTIEGVLNAGERVDLATMIAAYTIEGAWLMNHEAITGSIEPGKRGDIVVLDRNLFELPEADIGDAQVLFTLVDGRIVYERPSGSTAGGEPRGFTYGLALW